MFWFPSWPGYRIFWWKSCLRGGSGITFWGSARGFFKIAGVFLCRDFDSSIFASFSCSFWRNSICSWLSFFFELWGLIWGGFLIEKLPISSVLSLWPKFYPLVGTFLHCDSLLINTFSFIICKLNLWLIHLDHFCFSLYEIRPIRFFELTVLSDPPVIS